MNARGSNLKLFSVPKEKLILMSVCTYGLYSWYWLFENWSKICGLRERNCAPIFNTWLFPIYNHKLFEEIKNIAVEKGVRVKWKSSIVSIIFLLFLVGWYFPYTLFLSIFVGIALVPVNNTCAKINEADGFGKNVEGFDKKDWAIIFIGGIFVLMTLIKVILRSGVL